MKKSYKKAIDVMNLDNPYLTLAKDGVERQSVKKLIHDTLCPYFESHILEQNIAVEHLSAEAVNIARIQRNPEATALLQDVLNIHRLALKANRNFCLQACAYWENHINEGIFEFWSQAYLELDKATLDLDERGFNNEVQHLE